MHKHTSPAAATAAAEDSDLLWGGVHIAQYLKLTLREFYYLNSRNAFGNAVRRVSHRKLVASRSALTARLFAARTDDNAAATSTTSTTSA